MIHGCRFDSSGRQLYLVRSSNEASSSVERMYCDFLKLAHARKPRRSNDDTQVLAHKCDTAQAEGLPKKALKRLAAVAPWKRDGVGWRPELIASVRRVELWLRNHTLGASTEFDVATAKFLSGAYDRAIGFEHEGAVGSNVDSVGEKNISKGHDNRSRSDNRINIGSKEIYVHDEGAEGTSRDLQQFFCLPANLDALLLAAFSGLDDCLDEVYSGKESIDSQTLHESQPEPQLMSQEQHSNRPLRRQRRFIAVEPSCGDGRILARLCAMMNSSDASASTVGDQYAKKNSLTYLFSAAAVVACCVGVELDPVMAETSRATVANRPVPRGISQPYGCPVVCNDFLRTSGSALAQALASYHCEHRGASFGGDAHESSSQLGLKRPRSENYSDGSEDSGCTRSDGHQSSTVVDSSAWPPVHHCYCSGATDCIDTLEVLVVGGPPYTDYTAASAQGGEEDRGSLSTMPDTKGSRAMALPGTGLAFLSRGSSAVAAAANDAVRLANGLTTERESTTESPPTTDAANQAFPASISRDGEASLLDEEAANIRISTRAPTAPFRSLPLRFVLHAARPVAQGGLGATRVCYLLPARCAKPAFAHAVAEGLRQHESNCDTSRDPRYSCDLPKGGDDEENDGGLAKLGWNLQCQPAPEQRFSFRGRLVPQPSVIWSITRSS